MHPHLIFFDSSCGFCHSIVRFVLRHDKKELFIFAPLQGKTAKDFFHTIPNTIVLVENYKTPQQKISQSGRGALRILWLLGGIWKAIGWICFLPPILYNWIYRFIAKNRYKFFKAESFPIPEKHSSRFLL